MESLGLVNCQARKPIGWAISLSPDSKLTGKALTMAFESRGKPRNVMFYSDQGRIIQAVITDSYYGVINLSKVYLVAEITGTMVRWNASSEA